MGLTAPTHHIGAAPGAFAKTVLMPGDCLLYTSSILKSVEAEEYHVGFRESKTSEAFEQVEKGLADLGIIFLAEQSKGQMMQELRGRCSAIHGCMRGLADKVSLYRREYQ